MDYQSKCPFNFRRASYSIILVPSRFYLSNYFVKCTSVTAFNCSSRKWYYPDSHLHLNKRLFDKDKALNFEAYYDPEFGITTSINNSSQQLVNAWHYLEHTFCRYCPFSPIQSVSLFLSIAIFWFRIQKALLWTLLRSEYHYISCHSYECWV